MVELQVLRQHHKDKTPTPIGMQSFTAIPRVGDYLSIAVDEKAEAFVVKAVLHAARGGADLFVEQVGSEQELIKKLLRV